MNPQDKPANDSAEKEFAVRLEAEKQRWQAQKIEALGRLAGGIAHDFNNFLAVIMLHTDMLNLQLPADSPFKRRVDEIKAVTNTAAGVVRQLLAIARKQTLHPQPVILNDTIKEFSKTLPSITNERIDVRINLEPDLGVCFIDKDQLIQVLTNLAVNAKEAMPDGGVIEIKTANILFEKNSSPHKSQPNGSYIQISFSDTGVGIVAELVESIFEPFFTTKETGKGIGLGLATAYGIVKQSNGFIWVESEFNQGTTFKIQFPRVDQPFEKEEKSDEEKRMPKGDETILLVEDDDVVRRVTAEVLKMLGYQVIEATGGAQALEMMQAAGEPIHLLLTDIEMPHINGRMVAEKFSALQPESPVLFISGNIESTISQPNSAQEENFHYLSKPFSPLDLALKLREILDL